MKCLNCQKAVKQTPGKRPKLYCSPKCKAEYFKKRQPVDPNKRGPGRPKKEEKVDAPTPPEGDDRPKETSSIQDEPQKWNEPSQQEINNSIREQIKSIKEEKIPGVRDTVLGRKSWAIEQKKRIQELEAKLK
jgi:hypothetical protein